MLLLPQKRAAGLPEVFDGINSKLKRQKTVRFRAS
jgi:hypothetical protein